MIWFWLGFFALVGVLLFLDLAVLHRKASEPSLRSATWWTIGWIGLGLSFAGAVYLIYDHGWLGAKLHEPSDNPGTDAAITYVSAYLLEQSLSVDNIFVIWKLFHDFRVPRKYQHRVLFWGILGAIVFRVVMLAGGVALASRFGWVFYIFGAWLVWLGIKLLREDGDDEDEHKTSMTVRVLRRFVRIVDTDHGGRFTVRVDGRFALTTIAICLIVVELNDIVFALDSIPAVLSVSQDTFIVITSNIFAIMGLRSLYSVLAGAMNRFKYLMMSISILLIMIGVKMIIREHVHISHVWSLLMIAGIIGTGVVASMISSRRALPAESR
jgi:tellurite resistance protein TerC